jgi:hypothetical protein
VRVQEVQRLGCLRQRFWLRHLGLQPLVLVLRLDLDRDGLVLDRVGLVLGGLLFNRRRVNLSIGILSTDSSSTKN